MNALKIGSKVWWRTMFGQWFSGILIEFHDTTADVKRTNGGVCTVPLANLKG